MDSKLKERVVEWFVVVLLLGGVFYAATTAWKNETKLATVGEDVKSIKRSMVSLLLEDNPDKIGIAKDLVSETEFLEGVESFKSGEFQKAFQSWETAAKNGDRDAVYAIAVANDALTEKIQKADLSSSELQEIQQALEAAPKVTEQSGVYMLSSPAPSE